MKLLAIKFHLPGLTGQHVSRPQLIRRLNAGLEGGATLTLVSAPAGFGKTSVASEWVRSLELPAAWLSLERVDDDPGRFFTYFLAALQQIEPRLGREISAELRSGDTPPEPVISATLSNDLLEFPGKLLLALDDFHLIQDATILGFIENLLANQPDALHLVLVTREDPALPLWRLRASNRLSEIRAGDLRFNSGEVEQFFNQMLGLSLSTDSLASLENRTEGWAVGLQLAGLSLRGHKEPERFIANLSGNQRYILSYLTEEVLNRQPPAVQDFLLRTALLDKLNGELCMALTDRRDSPALLEELLAANLFLIPLDDEGRWYRYHHLFADLLRSQQGRLGKEMIRQLHLRASRWYARAEMANESLTHALAAEDYVGAMELLERHARRMILQGYARTVDGWLRAIPEEWHAHGARTKLALGWMHLLRGSYAQAMPYLEQVEASLGRGSLASQSLASQGLANEEARAVQAETLALRANLSNILGRAEESLDLAQQALKAAPPQDAHLLSLAYTGLGGAHRQRGDYTNAVAAYQQACSTGGSQATGSRKCWQPRQSRSCRSNTDNCAMRQK